MSKNNLEWQNGEYKIRTNKELLQIDLILDYLVNQSYWAKNRTAEQMQTVIENSLCFGLYRESRQIGFARVVTDFATFAYLGDVYVLPEFQGEGLGKWLIEVVVNHPDLQGFRRWILATRDAHMLYEKYGFTELKHTERWMEKADPNAY
ncbi:MAG: GNAT family N-acetyltransferase [Leptospiraceae bacterium]|nr:GNAT family N-acetyltransferase [Leptospiraceae bacterium]